MKRMRVTDARVSERGTLSVRTLYGWGCLLGWSSMHRQSMPTALWKRNKHLHPRDPEDHTLDPSDLVGRYVWGVVKEVSDGPYVWNVVVA